MFGFAGAERNCNPWHVRGVGWGCMDLALPPCQAGLPACPQLVWETLDENKSRLGCLYHWLKCRGLWEIWEAMRDCFGPTSLDEVAEERKLTVRAACNGCWVCSD
jgi:hypothetical protein